MEDARMKRKQLYITLRQDAMLKETAAKYRVSEGEIVRTALDAYLGRGVSLSLEPNYAAWQEELAFIRQRIEGRAIEDSETPGRTRRWRRDDLYDS